MEKFDFSVFFLLFVYPFIIEIIETPYKIIDNNLACVYATELS